MVAIWADFPAGTSNRENAEWDENGRNVWDFNYWGTGYTAIIQENCVDTQSNF
jgi:hypothetical protein